MHFIHSSYHLWRMYYYYYYCSHFTNEKLRLLGAKQFAACQGAPKWCSWIWTQIYLTPKPKLLTTNYAASVKADTSLPVNPFHSTSAAAWLDNLTSNKPGCIKFFDTVVYSFQKKKRIWSWAGWSTSKLGVCDNQVTFTRLLVPISQCQPSGPSENMCGFRT